MKANKIVGKVKYGFEYNSTEIVNEWIERKNLKTNRTITILERSKENGILFGASIRDECTLYKEQIATDTLVVSFFNKLKLKTTVFEKLYNLIMDIIKISFIH